MFHPVIGRQLDGNPTTVYSGDTFPGAHLNVGNSRDVPAKTASTTASGATTSYNPKSSNVSLDDPAWKVLPTALKKYKIDNRDWQDYVIFICYGNTERCISFDEKPLLVFQQLKEAKKNPVFMLKHITDIRSPIAVAKQKQAQRQESNPTVHPLVTNTRVLKAGAAPRIDTNPLAGVDEPSLSEAFAVVVTEEAGAASATHTDHGSSAEVPSGVSYAVSIEPYMAAQVDELDVVFGEFYVVLQRSRGWLYIQYDPRGTGIVDHNGGRSGWAPAECLLETTIPVAEAVSSASAILPLSIVSTNFPGVALLDHSPKGIGELDLVQGDAVHVFRRSNHWFYAVKERSGDWGWVPSWFIGTASSPSRHSADALAGLATNTSAAGTAAATVPLKTELRLPASSVELPLQGVSSEIPSPPSVPRVHAPNRLTSLSSISSQPPTSPPLPYSPGSFSSNEVGSTMYIF